jgi:hypothetical protein
MVMFKLLWVIVMKESMSAERVFRFAGIHVHFSKAIAYFLIFNATIIHWTPIGILKLKIQIIERNLLKPPGFWGEKNDSGFSQLTKLYFKETFKISFSNSR